MKFIGLKEESPAVHFRETLFQGVADDGSLFMPMHLPRLPQTFIHQLNEYSLIEMGTRIVSEFIDDIPPQTLEEIIQKTFSFPIPLVNLSPQLFLLELFHGPTLAFKDVGARFMAETLGYFLQKEQQQITIVVATSGDTGSAVAHGFYNVPNVTVYILYPSKKISHLQEQQMTTLGGNIYPIEVAGTFDDCQQLVKQSLVDPELKTRRHVTTANSINMGRLLPQIVYYFWGIAQLQKQGVMAPPSIVVPSGNFGNLTAAVFAKAMGAPIHQFIATTNSNDIIPHYLTTGILQPRPSHQTLSNAMDVGNPNNFSRIQALYHHDIDQIRAAITGIAISDAQTISEIQATYATYQYILDPHTAVGVAAAKRVADPNHPVIVAATAHPGKFPEVIQQALGLDIPVPDALKKVILLPKKSTPMEADFRKWRTFLLGHHVVT